MLWVSEKKQSLCSTQNRSPCFRSAYVHVHAHAVDGDGKSARQVLPVVTSGKENVCWGTLQMVKRDSHVLLCILPHCLKHNENAFRYFYNNFLKERGERTCAQGKENQEKHQTVNNIWLYTCDLSHFNELVYFRFKTLR